MFDSNRQLFCHRLVVKEDGLVPIGLSRRYTAITLLGLHEFALAGGRFSFRTQSIYNAIIGNTAWVHSIGDLGLLIWVTSALAPEELERRFPPSDLKRALNQYSDARKGSTMELAWFLAGLANAGLASPSLVPQLTEVAFATYHRLKENQGNSGLFGHLARAKSVSGFIRGNVGSFADQIYPVYAMSKFATTFNLKEPVQIALRCAQALCSTQGDMGQWWWLYESRSGGVLSRYPVYSVHQQGMGPMGLFALEEASGQSFNEFIYKGLGWIYGRNELSTDMRDVQRNVIWRCIGPSSRTAKYSQIIRHILRTRSSDISVPELKILFEDWPYELGWLLYAFSKAASRKVG
jgi:hypothetical protein